MSSERRRGERHRMWLMVQIVTEGTRVAIAMGRNISRSGILLATSYRMEVDQKIRLKLQLTEDSEEEREIRGKVVRYEPFAEDPKGRWPHRAAIEFDAQQFDLDPLLRKQLDQWETDYLVEIEEGID